MSEGSVRRPKFRLVPDGDSVEQRYWALFVERMFPSYERFWTAEVVPVTRRDVPAGPSIFFRSDEELAEVGRSNEDVVVAQLHYTVLVHLGRVFDLLQAPSFGRWSFAEAFVRCVGASDCADELLERVTTMRAGAQSTEVATDADDESDEDEEIGEAPSYSPWSETAGKDARGRWRRVHGRPLRDIHKYRNRLVHGRVVPELIASDSKTNEQVFIYPRLDRVDEYLDWRRVLPDASEAVKRGDFAPAQAIAGNAWERVVAYCEESWRTYLLPDDDSQQRADQWPWPEPPFPPGNFRIAEGPGSASVIAPDPREYLGDD